MVVVENSQDSRQIRIQARSHFSLGVGGLLTLILTLSGLTLLLALVAALQGYWPILTIAMVQVVLLAKILVGAWKSAWAVETITIDADRIAVLQEQYSGSSRRTFKTTWARVILRHPKVRWYTPTLWLSAGGRQVELGAFLNAPEKRELAEALCAAIEPYSAWQHDKIETEVS